ncbi:717_t:CDS:2 [Dentiscutata erythropus]|uniref:717_t:CDS:1 n=1 Tax=Dentiscutata erythropus TaxID=1348616 RepID=A0A9N9FFW9_9GLOM|nr:717_t:CDS:2 [Dentiscutata erythropus]
MKRTKKLQEQSDYEDLVWSDQDIDERASDYFSILLMAGKNKDTWKPLSRLLAYVGGSKRTQRYKRTELKKAVQNIQSIIAYFAPALTYSNIEVRSTEMELIEVGLTADVLEKIDIDEKTKIRLAIKELDRMLKKDNNQMDKGVRVRLQASLHLKYQSQTRISASTTIANNRGKFAKVSSLLDDKKISMKIMLYLRSHKFSINPKVLKNYIENEVFLSLEWRKDIYVDEHEREDVVQYRQTIFLLMMKELKPILLEYCDENFTKLLEKDIPSREKRHCVIIHDKTTLSADDDEKMG